MAVDGDTGQELLTSRVWPAVLVPAGGLVLTVVVGLGVLHSFPFVPVGLVLACVVLAVLLRNDALLADESGLLVRRRGRVTRSYRWDEVRRAGIVRPGFGQVALDTPLAGTPVSGCRPAACCFVGQLFQLAATMWAACFSHWA